MKKMFTITILTLGLITITNAQGITNTLGTNDNTSWFDVQNSDGTTPLLRIYGDGWTAFGLTNPESPFNVSANNFDDSGYWLQSVGVFENRVLDKDGVGIAGRCNNTDNWGVGVWGIGGWTGVRGEAVSTGTDNSLKYNGIYGYVEGGDGLNRGVKGYAINGYRAFGGYFEGSYASYRSWGVYGEGTKSPLNYGGYFTATDAALTGWNCGVYGSATTATATNYGGYFTANDATTNWAGWFQGNVNVTGDLTTSTATYKIDHPLDPENQYLSHASVESSDMMNIYNGNAELNYAGEAEIELPDWLEALNSDFRYQLTAIGAPAPNLYIAQEVNGNTFRVAGGEPGMKVSWQITGIRKDAYAVANRVKVEEYKAAKDIGKYLNPEAFGMSKSQRINNEPTLKNEMLAKDNKRRERR